jgi:hypothetical protein
MYRVQYSATIDEIAPMRTICFAGEREREAMTYKSLYNATFRVHQCCTILSMIFVAGAHGLLLGMLVDSIGPHT